MNDHPDPSEIRPEPILKKALKMLIKKWNNNDIEPKIPYNYFDEQFRSIRQDLTVQHIQTRTNVKVYEANAKIALDVYDLEQFNQCQSALILLYNKGLVGHNDEFFAYKILYSSLIQENIVNILQETKEKYQEKPKEIEHALEFLNSCCSNDYIKVFQLYLTAPNRGKKLIEPFLPRLRMKCLIMISISYITTISIKFIMNCLGYRNLEELMCFLDENELKYDKEKDIFYCRDNNEKLRNSKFLLKTYVKYNN